jgi:hypothetical protein
VSFQGFAGPGANPSPMLGEVARGIVSTRTSRALPYDVIAAAREERSLRRLQRRITWWQRLGLIR